jgi:hypothetical protein
VTVRPIEIGGLRLHDKPMLSSDRYGGKMDCHAALRLATTAMFRSPKSFFLLNKHSHRHCEEQRDTAIRSSA